MILAGALRGAMGVDEERLPRPLPPFISNRTMGMWTFFFGRTIATLWAKKENNKHEAKQLTGDSQNQSEEEMMRLY